MFVYNPANKNSTDQEVVQFASRLQYWPRPSSPSHQHRQCIYM